MFYAKEVKEALGERASLSRPNAVILSYPVVTMENGITHEGTTSVITNEETIPYDTLSLEKRVTENSVPAFIWHTMEDDCVPAQNSLYLAAAYKKDRVSFSLYFRKRMARP